MDISPERAEAFLLDASRIVAQLKALQGKSLPYDDADQKLYITSVHAMKSVYSNIGEPQLSAQAAALEQAGRLGDIPTMESCTAGFVRDLEAVIGRLKGVIATQEAAITAEADFANLYAQLRQMRLACEAFEQRNARSILRELRGYSWPLEIKILFLDLHERLISGELDDAIRLIDAALEGEEEGI